MRPDENQEDTLQQTTEQSNNTFHTQSSILDLPPIPTPPMPVKSRKKILVLGAVFLIIVAGMVSAIDLHKHTTNTNSVQSLSQNSSDVKTEQNLVTINKALTASILNLPSKLNQLHVGKISSTITYKVDPWPAGDINQNPGYQLCASFVSDTFTALSFSNAVYNGDNPSFYGGNSLPYYSVHDKGPQCFGNVYNEATGDSAGGGTSFQLILNTDENMLVQQACNDFGSNSTSVESQNLAPYCD